jgi:hypothetical protein
MTTTVQTPTRGQKLNHNQGQLKVASQRGQKLNHNEGGLKIR